MTDKDLIARILTLENKLAVAIRAIINAKAKATWSEGKREHFNQVQYFDDVLEQLRKGL